MAFISEGDGGVLVKNYTQTSGTQTRSAFFNKEDLLDLLGTAGAAGLRFYLGKDSEGKIILIGTPEDGSMTRLSNGNGVLLYDIKCPDECTVNPL